MKTDGAMLMTFAAIVLTAALGVAAAQAVPPVVKLDYGAFTGMTSGDVSSFLGIPFAQPP